MKTPHLYKITNPAGCSFNTRIISQPFLHISRHYHPEHEIVLILESTGKKYIGTGITSFRSGDICLIGPNLPHLYRNDDCYYEHASSLSAKAIMIEFDHNFVGKDFWHIPESAGIKRLLHESRRGIQFDWSTSGNIRKKIVELVTQNGIIKVAGLIQLLDEMSRSKNIRYLTAATDAFEPKNDPDKLSIVFDHIAQNFHQNILLGDMARLVNMSESAFSRHFKHRTQKTFSCFLKETRIEHACKMLQHDSKSIFEISLDSGFNNLSNFNKQFKSVKNMAPLAYRQSCHHFQHLHA